MRRTRHSINITEQLEHIVDDLCARIPDFAHIDSRRVLVCAARARRSIRQVTYARIIPMRFPDGSPFKTVKGEQFALPQIPTPAGDVLYLIYVYVPHFFEQPFERRVLTLIHELYHIAPAFDGTIRRFGSRAHGASRERYNDRLQPLIDGYLTSPPANGLLDILTCDFKTLCREYQPVARTLRLPKAIRVR